MARPLDLGALREIFSDGKLHIACAQVLKTTVASDSSTIYVRMNILPEKQEVVGKMSWDSIGPGAGFFQLPQPEDLVLIGFCEGDSDQIFVIRRLSTQVDFIPEAAKNGDTVLKSLPDKKVRVGKAGDTIPQEAVVLGNVLKTHLTALYDAILNAPQIGIGPLGPVVLDPALRTLLVAQKLEFLTTASTNILSQVFFTERGD